MVGGDFANLVPRRCHLGDCGELDSYVVCIQQAPLLRNTLHSTFDLSVKDILNKGHSMFYLSIKDKFCGPYRTIAIQFYLLKRTTSV